EQVRSARLRLLPDLGRGRDLERHGRDGHAGRPGRGGRVLPAASRGLLALLHRVLPDPGRADLHGDGDLHATGTSWLLEAPAEPVAAPFSSLAAPLLGFSTEQVWPVAPGLPPATAQRASSFVLARLLLRS